MDKLLRRKLSVRWYHLKHRCYNPDYIDYKYYGALGVKMCDRWLDKENFIEDCLTLAGYDESGILNGSLHLDKDSLVKGNKMYSPDLCIFIPHMENNKHKPNQMREFEGIDPQGVKYVGYNQSDFAKQHNLRQSSIADCLRGRLKTHKKWSFKYL